MFSAKMATGLLLHPDWIAAHPDSMQLGYFSAGGGPGSIADLPDWAVPDLVLDCIDDVKTKAELLTWCVHARVPAISSLGAGGKLEGTRLHAGGLADVVNEALGKALNTKLRQTLAVDTGAADTGAVDTGADGGGLNSGGVREAGAPGVRELNRREAHLALSGLIRIVYSSAPVVARLLPLDATGGNLVGSGGGKGGQVGSQEPEGGQAGTRGGALQKHKKGALPAVRQSLGPQPSAPRERALKKIKSTARRERTPSRTLYRTPSRTPSRNPSLNPSLPPLLSLLSLLPRGEKRRERRERRKGGREGYREGV
ncbi:hypothetical protein T492DRAFT_278780 [Pavlovales sp. CCMP2436]|nr:hypothetical protein T492DRAFT_278780 [Pavlovales sp. CCMP2436]